MTVSDFFEKVYPLFDSCSIAILAQPRDEHRAAEFIGYLTEHNQGITKELLLQELSNVDIAHMENGDYCINLVLGIDPNECELRLTETRIFSAQKLYDFLSGQTKNNTESKFEDVTFNGMYCTYSVDFDRSILICNTVNTSMDVTFDTHLDVRSFFHLYLKHGIKTIKVLLPRKLDNPPNVEFSYNKETGTTNIEFN